MKHLSPNNNIEVVDGSSNSNDLGYELRKDPKKTTKANDFVVFDKLCKECGKGFQSWKALFGHMKCHSNKVSNTKSVVTNQESWISRPEDSGMKMCQMKKSRSRNEVTKTDSSSISVNANHTSTSVVSDLYDEKEAEIAMCLIMLSRDVGKCDKKMKKVTKANDDQDEMDDQNKRKFECSACNKSFHSYQALGGHKASHKKLKGCFDAITSEPMLEHDHMYNGCCEKPYDDHQSPSSFNLVGSLKNTKVEGAHECSICLRIFSSGQALGGHKRSHLIAEAKLNQQNLNLIEKFDKPVHEIRGLFDLNMPPDDLVEEEQQETLFYLDCFQQAKTSKSISSVAFYAASINAPDLI
ncbi:hypothetical protein QVD17_15909 [Tagetes erecta]|uniref:C2H2-type domain-containing protein n=1 Tax=Tagetes erecta TaxID=13708 RepID=A0AAD8KU13_TARER|nr:hypothetical protein QVD17_15909 [Tagetes erecta]